MDDLKAQIKEIKKANLEALMAEIKGIVATAIEDIKAAAAQTKEDIKGEVEGAIQDALDALSEEAEEGLLEAAGV